MQPILRSVSKDSSGRAYALGSRLTIGRDATSDIQLVHETVSRKHAVVEREADGSHVLTDLGSRTGTRLDGASVRSAVMYLGATIEICGFRLRFELAADLPQQAAITKVLGEVAKRPTLAETRSTIEYSGGSVASRVVDEHDDWRRVLGDIVGARTLGEVPMPAQRIKFLAARFDEGGTDTGSRRRSRRHRIETQVRIGVLRREGGVTIAGRMLNASATGAKLQTNEALPVGGLCWILVSLGESDATPISFAARVVWSDAERNLVGVTFVGKPATGTAATSVLEH